jgi:hypothetical protein
MALHHICMSTIQTVFKDLSQTQTIDLDEIVPPFKKPNATDLKNAIQFSF